MVRGGVLGAVDSERVVIGDLVPIRHEVKTCCDLLVVETNGLHVSEQMFTGESDPKEKRAIRDGLPSDTSIRRHENVVYDGTIPVGARNKILGYGIVIGVGKNTVMGSKLMSFREEKSVSPLAAKIDQVRSVMCFVCAYALFTHVHRAGFHPGHVVLPHRLRRDTRHEHRCDLRL